MRLINEAVKQTPHKDVKFPWVVFTKHNTPTQQAFFLSCITRSMCVFWNSENIKLALLPTGTLERPVRLSTYYNGACYLKMHFCHNPEY